MPNHHTRRILALGAAFLLLAVVHTWPLAADPVHWSRIDNGDGALNTWAVAWVAHHLTHDPWHLFEGNIFYPEHLTLAYSEAMLVQGAIAVPVISLGGSAVLAYNVAVLSGFAFTAFAFGLLVWRWTGSWSAGFVAGSLAAFNSHTLTRLPQLQALHTEFVPIMLFALDRLIVERRFVDVWWLAIGFVLQGLTSLYLLVYSVWMLVFAAAARAGEWLRAGAAGMIARFAAAGVLATVLLLPYLIPYHRLRATMSFARTGEEQQGGRLADYLSSGSRVHYEWWSRPYAEASVVYAFPGVIALCLLVAAFTNRETRRDARVRMCVVVAIGCVLVSLAPRLPFYDVLHRLNPLFQAIRTPATIAEIVLLMIAVLAGFGVAVLQRRWGQARAWPAVAAALCVLVNAEALRAPMRYTWFAGIPETYQALAADPRAVVAEMPFPMGGQWFLNGPYMVYSTAHWRPLLNGYSGFRPASYEASYEATRGFPSDTSLIKLYARGVTHVVVHHQAFRSEFGEARFNAIAGVHSLQYVASDEDMTIYRLLTP